MASWWRSYIAHRSRQLGLDPRAVLAIAGMEGLSGGVGDQGTSFGPFMLHRGGALPPGKTRAWAESPAGIDYALRQIAGVARGLRGRAAIEAISRRFERPADPAREIAGALRSYGGPATAGGGAVSLPTGGIAPTAFSPPDLSGLRSQVLASLIAASQATGHHEQPNYLPLFQGLSALHRGSEVSSAPGSMTAAGEGPPGGGSSLKFLEPFGARYGLKITSTTGGKHVEGSYHYLGRAVDFAGSPDHMLALMDYALAHPRQFKEAFYDPAGAYVKNGKVYRGAIGGHRDHVHLAR